MPDCAKSYVAFLQRCPCVVILVFVIVAMICAPFMMQLGSTTTDNFGATPGLRSYDEINSIKAQFPSVFNDIETVYVKCVGRACDPMGFKYIFDHLADGMKEYIHDGTLVGTSSYFDFKGELSSLGTGYYNKSASSMIETLEFATSKGEDAVKKAVTKALAVIAEKSPSGFQVYLTGQTAVRLQATKEAGKLIGMADGTGMIFIVLLFGWQVRSWRLTLIPVFNTLLCLLITEGLVFALSSPGIITLPSYVPNVCLFLSIALSVDYSFFHLSRFQEVRREGMDVVESVEEMVRTAGRVVLVSGVVLLFTWLALVAFPVFGVNSLGICSAITIFVCIFVNMFMNSAIILALPGFFSRAAQDPCHCCRCRRRARDTVVAAAPLTGEDSGRDESKNCYGAIASAIVRMPLMIIVPILVFALLTPAAVALFTSDFTVGGISGSTADSDKAKQGILQDFPGTMGGVPLTILFSAPNGQSVKSEEYFKQGCALAQDLQHESSIPIADFHGVMLQPLCSHWGDVEKSLTPGSMSSYFWRKSVNPSNTSTLLTVSLPFDAFSDKAKVLVKQGRRAIDKFSSADNGAAVALFHPMSIEVDAEDLTWRRFPIVIVITLLIVFSVIAVRYGAALIPLKLFFTIALPIVSVLGTGVFVFQDGALNWTGIPSLQSSGGLVWINPVACSFMLIGFALDYDIFLFSRIYADRKSGKFTEDEPAIINAVAKTGPIITTAGVIMALAFSGMVVQSSNAFLCQMGFTMIYGILVDTFVVRTLLVPAFLSMAGRFNWWPGKMPSKNDSGDPQEISIQGPSTFGA